MNLLWSMFLLRVNLDDLLWKCHEDEWLQCSTSIRIKCESNHFNFIATILVFLAHDRVFFRFCCLSVAQRQSSVFGLHSEFQKPPDPLDEGPERYVDVLHLLFIVFIKQLWLLSCEMVFPVTHFTCIWKGRQFC